MGPLYSEGRERCAAALSRPGAQERTEARAGAFNGAGYLAELQGDYAWARSFHEESLALRRELGDKKGMAASLNNLGAVADFLGDTASARSLFEESLAILREKGDKRNVAISLVNLGMMAENQGDTASARSLYEEGLAIQRELGNKSGIVFSLCCLWALACKERDYAGSWSCLAEGLSLCRALGDKRSTASALAGCAGLARAQGQPQRAVLLFGAADALREAVGIPLTPDERQDMDRDVAALRAGLDADAFNTAWSEGQALTWEQAIEYALEENVP